MGGVRPDVEADGAAYAGYERGGGSGNDPGRERGSEIVVAIDRVLGVSDG